jgi:hypothetical protein
MGDDPSTPEVAEVGVRTFLIADIRGYTGAIVLANGVDVDREVFFRRLLAYGAVVVAVAPLLLWLPLVVPGS